MKKKYICGIAAALVVILLVALSTVVFGAKYTLKVSKDEGYQITVKDVKFDTEGKASVTKGEKLVFAVTLDKAYSDSNVKVKVNNNEVSAQNGVYRYTVTDKNTDIKVEGVTKNDHIVSGIDVEPGTMDDQKFTMLRDEKGVPIPVLSDINLNGIDTYDVPDLDLTASVSESINPGWKYRELSEVNLGKYAGVKFFVKNSNYLQSKVGDNEDFSILSGSEDWNEFLFKYEDGAINLYVNGSYKVNCNYLSDIQMCLQEEGSYKFSNIYVIERDDYKGANVTISEGDGYYVDLAAREYAVNTKLIFKVDIDDDYKQSSNFQVKAGSEVLKPDEKGRYSFVLKKDTAVSVSGVVPKPLDSRYVVIDSPFFVDGKVTTNYSIMNTVKNTKTYTYSQNTWGRLGMPEVNLEKYTSILFFVKKDDTDAKSWILISQIAEDGTETSYCATNDNKWHRIEVKKEGGKMYVYTDGEKNDTPVIDAEHLYCTVNENTQMRFTSMVGIVDKNYKEPAPDYLSSKYKTIDTPIIVDAKTVSNYELIKKVKNAKTYRFVPEQWCSLAFNADVNFDKYKEMVFFVHKEDKSSNNWIVFSKVDSKGTEVKQYIAQNNNRWYKVELKKVSNGKFNVFVNGVKQDETVAGADELKLTFNEKSEITFTSLMGIKDSKYKEPTPDYLSTRYKTIGSPIAVQGTVTDNYVLMKKVKNSYTYSYKTTQWQKVGFTDVNFDAYKDLVFFIHKNDRSISTWIVLQKEDTKGNVKAAYLQANDTKWYKVQLKKVKNGKFDIYINGEKQSTTVSSADELKFLFNADSEILFTSLVGIKDSNYKEPMPDYISSKYKAIAPSLAIEGQPIENYNRLDKTAGAKTYSYTSEQWGEISFGEFNLAKYSKATFFLHKEDYNTANWLELYKKDKDGNHTNYIQNNDNKWYEVVLKKKEGTNTFEVYVNGEKQKGTISDISELKVCINGKSTLHYTSIMGIVDSNYKEPEPEYLKGSYKAIAPVLAASGAEMENYVIISKIPGAKTYTYTAEQWGARDIIDIDFAPYKNLVFYMKKADLKTANWLEFYKTGQTNTYFLQNNDNQWYKIELKKNSSGKFDVYINDTKKGSDITKGSQLKVCLNGNSVLYYTSLLGIEDPNYKEPEAEVRGIVAAMAPWAYGKGTIDETKTAKTLGYEYASLITGSNDTYAGALMTDIDLSEYQSFRFALKSTDDMWWEIGYVATNSYSLIANKSGAWVEYEFKNEGNGKFAMYQDGEKTSITIADDMNLSSLQMKFATSGTLYMTEVRGQLKDNTKTNVETVAENFNSYVGTFTDSEKPVRFSTGATVVDTTWSAEKFAMTDVNLKNYSKVIFYARKISGSGWFESNYLGSDQLGNNWVEFKLVKNADKTWNMYRGGKLISENIAIDNLSSVLATYGDARYAFSQVFAVKSTVVEPDEPETPDVTGTMIALSPWTYGKGTVDNKSTWKDGGYAYATTVEGSNDTYTGTLMTDADLSLYKEVRFALKSNTNIWYEIGKVSDGNFGFIANASPEWVEIKLVDEGNGYFQIYVKAESQTDIGWVNKNLPLDTNLSDLQMKFATTGTLVMTEVRGILRDKAKSSLKKITDSLKTGGEEVTNIEKPINETTKVSKVTTSWGWTDTLPDVDLSKYKSIRFYVRNVNDGAAYVEMKNVANESAYAVGVVCKSWTEIRFVRNSDNTWKLLVAGQTNDNVNKLNISNLKEMLVNYGSNTLYMTDVLGVEN